MPTPRTGKPRGRPVGAVSQATKDIKALANVHGEECVKTLLKLMKTSSSDVAKIAAAKELLDRGFGKAKQSIDHSSEDGSMTPKGLADFYAERAHP